MRWDQFPQDDVLSEYDWEAAFGAVMFHTAGPPAQLAVPITNNDVAEVTNWFAECSEGWGDRNMFAVMRLNDGRWASLEAWCDTTGWGCQDGGEITIADSYMGIVFFGMGDEMRTRLNITIPEYVLRDTRESLIKIENQVEGLEDDPRIEAG